MERARAVQYDLGSPLTRVRRWVRPLGIEKAWFVLDRAVAGTSSYHRPDIDPAAVVEQASAKHLVFAVTAGRTGTTFLTQLLGGLPDVSAHHEPEPQFEHVVRRVQRHPAVAREFWLHSKLPEIVARPEGTYVELSNVFAKGFFEPLVELGLRPDLLVLRRDPRAVASSYLQRFSVPGRTKLGWKYLVHPGDPGVIPMPPWKSMSDYEICFWYALEMERRQAHYAVLAREFGARVHEATTADLSDVEGFLAMTRGLGLTDDPQALADLRRRHAEVSQVRHNPNAAALTLSGDLDAAEERVWEWAVRSQGPAFRRTVEQRYASPPGTTVPPRRGDVGS